MALIEDNRENTVERDPRLARLIEAAGGEVPPAAIDEAILAAARREVSARPLAAGGSTQRAEAPDGGEAVTSLPRRKRNWYVPVSIAAVLVMSASLVILMHEEKGDDLEQLPHRAPAPVPAPAPVDATQPTPAESAAVARPEVALRDVESKREKAKPGNVFVPAAAPSAEIKSVDGDTKKQRKQSEQVDDKRSKLDRAEATGKIVAGDEPKWRDTGASGLVDRPASTSAPAIGIPEVTSRQPRAALGGTAVGASDTPSPAPRVRERRSEPFPAAREQVPALATQDGKAAARVESDRNVSRDVLSVAPPPASAAMPRSTSVKEDGITQAAPPLAEGRFSSSAPPRQVMKSASAPTLQRSSPQKPVRPAWLIELDNQPPEKWLERLSLFKRDGLQVEADELLVEFRRRFPDHPAGARGND